VVVLVVHTSQCKRILNLNVFLRVGHFDWPFRKKECIKQKTSIWGAFTILVLWKCISLSKLCIPYNNTLLDKGYGTNYGVNGECFRCIFGACCPSLLLLFEHWERKSKGLMICGQILGMHSIWLPIIFVLKRR
jgi:hypothetical protein